MIVEEFTSATNSYDISNLKPYPPLSDELSRQSPAAQDDTAVTAENAAISVDVLANDTDPDAGEVSYPRLTRLENGLK